jgi:ribonuclease BN (tRNA processing enzyme)
MLLKILGSGSSGNCYILENDNGNQLMIDCGIKYENVVSEINFSKLVGVLISHEHKDHSLERNKFVKSGIDVYDHSNLIAGKVMTIANFDIMPITVKHGNEPNFAFIIKDKITNKKLLYMTDLEVLPPIKDSEYEFIMIETNYSEEIIFDKISKGINYNKNCFTHNSLENAIKWLSQRQIKPQNLVLIHLSETGLLDVGKALQSVRKFSENSFVAKPNIKIQS